MSDLLLSRTLDRADYTALSLEATVVDDLAFPNPGPGTHRRWEYALALHAVRRWLASGRTLHDPLYDVGTAGSDFFELLGGLTDGEVLSLDATRDPTLQTSIGGGAPLADIVTCLSVIDRVPELEPFLYRLSCLLAPGGLLVLTMAYWNRCGADTALGHEQRARIFCPKSYAQLRNTCVPLHLTTFGGVDPTYHGVPAHAHDHTVASLVLEKRR